MPEATLYTDPHKFSIDWWPSVQDYKEAIQNPLACLSDSELRNSMPYTTAIGLPRVVTGSFASVYRMHSVNKDYSLRLFLKNIKDQAERYARISDFVQNDDLPCTVTFDFLTRGIKFRNEWLPALKMEWVEGLSFDDYIVENLRDSNKLGFLASSFMKMMEEMQAAGIAHGDLQHGNIIVCNDELRLVDYDGMYVPAMRNFASNELGHPNYQHPNRDQRHFGPYLDNFSAWIIYASIKALQIDPQLLNQLGGCDDCLLFRKSDFLEPLQSPAFAAFEKHENEELRKLGNFVRAQLSQDVHRIPYLQQNISTDHENDLPPIAEEISTVKQGPRLLRSKGWLDQENVEALPNFESILFSAESGYEEGKTSWIVQTPLIQQSIWVKPASDDTFDLVSSALYLPANLVQKTPRPTQFNTTLKSRPPEFYHRLMLLNPFVWCMSHSFSVFAIHLGSQQSVDAFPQFAVYALINLIAEYFIWTQPLWHRHLATNGIATFATIGNVWKTPTSYTAKISYDLGSRHYSTTLHLRDFEFQDLQPGTKEVILCDPEARDRFVFYKFCKYQAIPTSSPKTP